MNESVTKPRSRMKWIIAGLFVVAASVLFHAFGTSSTNWKEEVKLADGAVIVVKRTASAKTGGEIGGPGSVSDEKTSVRPMITG